jgi:histidinol-phosphate aminotransferase
VSYLRAAIDARRASVPGEQPADAAGWIKLNTNENPAISPRVLDAVRAAVTDQLRIYPDAAWTTLRQKLATTYDVQPEQVFVGNGSDEILALLVRATTDPGDRIAFPDPTFSYYLSLAQIQGAEPVAVPLGEGFALPVEALIAARPRLCFVANPNSPTGTYADRETVRRLATGLSCLLVLDEAYTDFSPGSALPLLRDLPNLVVVRTMSKSFSLAGMRIGYAFASPEVTAGLMKVKDIYNLSRLAQAAAEAALDDVEWFRANNRAIVARRERYARVFSERFGFHVYPSAANFVLLDTGARPAQAVYDGLKARRILVRGYFGHPRIANCLRVTIGSEEQMQALVAALADLTA